MEHIALFVVMAEERKTKLTVAHKLRRLPVAD